MKLQKKSAYGMLAADPTERYYYELWQKSRRFRVGLHEMKWCDGWHQHFDWNGFGSHGWLHRRRHISALLVALTQAKVELAQSNQAHQVFASIHITDPGSDAIYVHTENPNGTEFPLVHIGTRIHSIPALLASRIDLARFNVFASEYEGERYYVIEPKMN
jgi:hypothetical protein